MIYLFDGDHVFGGFQVDLCLARGTFEHKPAGGKIEARLIAI
jgi:hypothetical protein